MPTLNWIGKEAVLNHHREVPYRMLRCDGDLSVGDPGSGNLLVQGDNLEALKALLPYYRGKVKCIYIDPPYNTGNEGWAYNDNVNSPEIRKWLGQVVDGEKLDRHDRWLCMMWPRLSLLQKFLSEDGAIFVSIDDNEVHNLRFLLDAIFRPANFIAGIVWQKRYVANAAAEHMSDMHDHILVYGNKKERLRFDLLDRTEEQEGDYKNPDDDPRGPWRAQDLSASKSYSAGLFTITGPNGDKFDPPPQRYWRTNEAQYTQWLMDSRITFGITGKGRPMLKRFLSEAQAGLTPTTWWTHEFAGHNKEATLELKRIFDGSSPFDTPKPSKLLSRVLELVPGHDFIVLDSFSGSGTTAHAVHKMNEFDGGSRRSISVEMDTHIAKNVTAERLKRVGVPFRYCTLGPTLFDADGLLDDGVSMRDLAHHIWFAETKRPLQSARSLPWIGEYDGRGYYLVEGPLNHKVLGRLPPFDGPKTIYAECLRITETTLVEAGIEYKRIPYDVRDR